MAFCNCSLSAWRAWLISSCSSSRVSASYTGREEGGGREGGHGTLATQHTAILISARVYIIMCNRM